MKKAKTVSDPRLLYLLKTNLLDYVQFFSDFDKCGNCFIQMFCFVAGGQLYADTCLVFRYYRIVETGYVNVFFLQFCCELL